MAKLNESEREAFLAAQPKWALVGGVLTREWKFKDFVEAMAFVNRVASLAEEVGHHPDIDIRYNTVRLGLISHDSKGITGRDTAMVTRLDREF
jgi:4a-hydroxytetrahydrobiopterin dehydratase